MWEGMEERGRASQGRRGGPCLDPATGGEGAGSGGRGETGAWFGANGQAGGSEGGEGGPEEARMEGARKVTGSLGGSKIPLEAESLDFLDPKPSLVFAILLAGSGTTPGEKAFSVCVRKSWKMSTFNSSG